MAGGIVETYLSGDARRFFPDDFRSAATRARVLSRCARPLAPRVADAIEAQNARFGASEARQGNLAALRSGAAAVVTGQQVGLLLGPLYTVYKAASAIAVARALAAESGRQVVPVFWLQTEDHDLPEVASCHVRRRDGALVRIALPAPVQRTSLAHVPLPAEIDSCLATLRQALADLPDEDSHLARLTRHYRVGASYAQAFAGVLAELFEREGLVLVDPRDPALARAVAPVHERALRDADALGDTLLARSDELTAAGFSPSVHVRPGSPLSFFHAERADGPRYRLAPAGAQFEEIGGAERHSLASLLELLSAEPMRFSTSALLRPIVQDTLLPTAAYVGGPGEIAYFAQLSSLYEAFGMTMPLIVPRARFLCVEPRARRVLARYGLNCAAASLPLRALIERALPRTDASGSGIAANVQERILAAFRQARADAPKLPAELDAAVRRTEAALTKACRRFSARVDAARLRADAAVESDLQRLQLLLHPLGQPQERVLGLAYHAARYGERAFLDQVMSAIDPWDGSLKELEL